MGLLLLLVLAMTVGWALTRAGAAPGAHRGLVERVDALLPQTQCGQCGFRGCRPYAEAIARGQALINRCPPGGETTLLALVDLLGVDPLPLDPACGAHRPARKVIIEEAICIGCTKCIRACPMDAIVGAPKLMHTVIAAACTGCELCLPPCPVDCIRVIPEPAAPASWKWPLPAEAVA